MLHKRASHVERVLGMTNLGRVANHVKADLPLVDSDFHRREPEAFH